MVLIGVIILFKNLLPSRDEFQSQVKVVFEDDFIFVAQLANLCVEQHLLGDVEIVLPVLVSAESTGFDELESCEDLFDAHPEGRQDLPHIQLGEKPFLGGTQHFIEYVIELLLGRKPNLGNAVFILFLDEALEVLLDVPEKLHEVLALLVHEKQFGRQYLFILDVVYELYRFLVQTKYAIKVHLIFQRFRFVKNAPLCGFLNFTLCLGSFFVLNYFRVHVSGELEQILIAGTEKFYRLLLLIHQFLRRRLHLLILRLYFVERFVFALIVRVFPGNLVLKGVFGAAFRALEGILLGLRGGVALLTNGRH